jgi:hypothetical protein
MPSSRTGLPLALLLAFASMSGACAMDLDPSVGSSQSALEGGDDEVGGNCPKWGCGTNAASMGDALSFHELNTHPDVANDVGLRVVGFTSVNGTPLTLQIHGTELSGTYVDSNGQVVVLRTDEQLRGAKLELRRGNDPFTVTIAAVGRTLYWVPPHDVVLTYTFTYTVAGDRVPLCPGNQGEAESDPRWTGIQTSALVFAGDRYDAAAKTVTLSTPASGWFNVACARTAPAKMLLLRHTTASGLPANTPTVGERQAMLKLITADVCGGGISFTRDGHPLQYGDQRSLAKINWNKLKTVEAKWDASGARCLSTPRRADEDPHLWAKIAHACFLAGRPLPPPCAPGWEAAAYGMSVNPLP